jgi:hypothetical protein
MADIAQQGEDIMAPRIKHIALSAEDPAKTAAFYTQNRHLVAVIYNKFNDLNVIYDF